MSDRDAGLSADDPGCCGCITLVIMILLALIFLKILFAGFAYLWNAIPTP